MKRLVVHLHLYYLGQLPEIMNYLSGLKGTDYDLFVTMVERSEKAISQIKAVCPDTHVIIVPNYGYDVGPFIEFLHRIDLNKYDYVLKIHTKGDVSKNHICLNGRRMDNKLWKKILFDALLKDKERVQNNLAVLEQNPKIGMLSSKYCITKKERTYKKLLPQINKALTDCGFEQVGQVQFVAGTMFYVRAKLLAPLLKYTIKDFSKTDGSVKEGTFAHVVERLLGALVQAQGYSIDGIQYDRYNKEFIRAALKHFLFQKKQTQNHTLIKICKIPIYSKKIKRKESP